MSFQGKIASIFSYAEQSDSVEGDFGIPLTWLVQVKGEIDEDLSLTVEFWAFYLFEKRIGVFHGDLVRGVDMKIPDSTKVVIGEARMYVVESGEYDVLIFEAYGTVHLPYGPIRIFPDFKQEIKRWEIGKLSSIQDVPNTSGVQALSSDAGVDTSFSVE